MKIQIQISKILIIPPVLLIFLFLSRCSDLRETGNNSGNNSKCSALECHASTLLSRGIPLSGKHTPHLQMGVQCGSCHYNYQENITHRNGILDTETGNSIVYFDASSSNATWNPGDRSCSSINCHYYTIPASKNTRNDNRVTTRSDIKVFWYEASSGCLTCHGTGSPIDPMATNGSGVNGKHTAHVSEGGIDCVSCHNSYTLEPSHMNGITGGAEPGSIVSFNGNFLGISISASFDSYLKICGNISCHGGTGAIDWYAASVVCTDCHTAGSAIDPLATSGNGAAGKHVAHVTTRGIDCDVCHKDYKDKPSHINGIYGKAETDIIVYFNTQNPSASWNDGSGTCNTMTCHGSTDWYSASAGCTVCHSSGSSIDPVASNGSGLSGKHTAHVTNKGIDCEVCHKDYKNKPAHMNGTYGKAEADIIVYFDSRNPSASWNDGNTRCNNMTCHGSIDWYAIPSCNSCHTTTNGARRQVMGAGGDFGANPGILSHHVFGGSDPSDEQCKVCHYMNSHMDGVVKLKNADTGVPIAYNPSNPSTLETFCLSCHDSDGALISFVNPGGSALDPFYDGKALGTPPYPYSKRIASSWAKTYGHGPNGNHAAGSRLTCMGNGQPGTGCHGNGGAMNAHGSVNQVLLTAPFDYSKNSGSAYTEAWFALCLDCHSNYPGVKKEDIFGVKQSSPYDNTYCWNISGPNGVKPPYYIPSMTTHFADHNSATDPDVLSDVNTWCFSEKNLHWFHMRRGTNFRGTGASAFSSCVNCHDVHGSNTQYGAVYDEFNYINATTSNGNIYGKMDDIYSTSAYLGGYPFFCNGCHPQGVGVTRAWFSP